MSKRFLNKDAGLYYVHQRAKGGYDNRVYQFEVGDQVVAVKYGRHRSAFVGSVVRLTATRVVVHVETGSNNGNEIAFNRRTLEEVGQKDTWGSYYRLVGGEKGKALLSEISSENRKNKLLSDIQHKFSGLSMNVTKGTVAELRALADMIDDFYVKFPE